MKTLIYSDVHGNLPAFEAMLKHVGPCDKYICLGDLVNYGPWSNECIDLALSLPNSVFLLGNHEEAFISGEYSGENALVKKFFNVIFKDFTRIGKIKLFTEQYSFRNFTCTHTLDGKYIYPDTKIRIDKDYIIGHSHHQFLYCKSGFRLYNAGSVGQNRKNIQIANFLISSSEKGRIIMSSVEYKVDSVISKMESLGYPSDCIDYYKSKISP